MPAASSSRKVWLWITLALAFVVLIVAAVGLFLVMSGGRERIEVKLNHYGEGVSGHTLIIDEISHGLCLLPKPGVLAGRSRSRIATTYYHRHSPVGVVLERFNWFPGPENTFWADARLPASLVGTLGGGPYPSLATLWSEPPLGVIDLGVGTPASYARPYQIIDFYESNPEIRDLSINPLKQKFPYVQDALKRGAAVRLLEGTQRKTFAEQAPDGFYHVLVIETARGHPDYPSMDRLTREGMQLFFTKLAPDGILCYHTSNRNYQISQAIGAVANNLGHACFIGHDATMRKSASHCFTSEWVMVARDKRVLQDLPKVPGQPGEALPAWSPAPAIANLAWTDAVHNLGAVRR